MKKQNLISAAVCAGLTTTLFAGLAHAGDNPFAARQLSAGYQLAQADKKADGKCGEAKCGADKQAKEKKADGSCGGKKADAKCGADKKPSEKKKDGKCGEAKCVANK